MKNTFRLIGTYSRWLCAIAMVAVIGFSMTACKESGGGEGNNNNEGSAISFTESVTYAPSLGSDMTDAKSRTDFSYFYDGVPIINDMPGSSVTVSGEKVTFNLGVPKPEVLFEAENPCFSPSNAKIYDATEFATSDKIYSLLCIKDENNVAGLWYVDRSATIKGDAGFDGGSWNCSLKAGWNYIIYNYNNGTVTSAASLPSGFKWTVSKNY